jgi:hypothetical protein
MQTPAVATVLLLRLYEREYITGTILPNQCDTGRLPAAVTVSLQYTDVDE